MSWVEAATKLLNSLASVLTALGTLSGFVAAVGAIVALRRTGTIRPGPGGKGKHRRRDDQEEDDDHATG